MNELFKQRPKIRDTSLSFKIIDQRSPKGDQPKAIEQLTSGFLSGADRMTLLGVTGSGKTFTVAHLIEKLNIPTLIIAHNKTLAAQLYSEFAEIFPNNAVRYFVSYYDYYQPEAYVPSTDTYIEKDASINDEIDKLRHASTKALIERKDTIVVSSVSCIYGLGDPESYFNQMLYIEAGDKIKRIDLLRKLVFLQYQRQDQDFTTGTFRVRGDVIEICTADETDKIIRIELFGDDVEVLSEVDRLTGKVIRPLTRICIYPASHFVTGVDAIKKAIGTIGIELELCLKELRGLGKTLEADRLEQRTRYDMELLKEMGFCPGIENYSRHITGRAEGEPPPTLIDYFPDEFLVVIDESHVTTSQISGMFRGDQSRKQTLVDFGFRLTSALDNRPLKFEEFYAKAKKLLFVSATPREFEIQESKGKVVEQVIRPTGLLDPEVIIRPATSQVDDLLEEIRVTVERGERVLVTTLTKRMAEDLTEYYQEVGVRVKYLHSEIHTLDRIDLIRGLRQGEFDVLVGINLLREGLDLPEVSLVGILDADKEGFLRSETSLVQTIGRAARNINGRVILYADRETGSIQRAISETYRRRKIQEDFNTQNSIVPQSVSRSRDAEMIDSNEVGDLEGILGDEDVSQLPRDPAKCKAQINELRAKMFEHAKKYEFEEATVLRDRVYKLEKLLAYL